MKTFLFLLALLTAAARVPANGQTPPTELEGSWSILDTVIELRWHAPDVLPAPTHYTVYRKAGADPGFTPYATAGERRYDDAGVLSGTSYSYRVTAVYAATGESVPTNVVAVVAGGDSVPGGGSPGSLPPRDLTGSFDDRGVVELDWLWPDSGHSPLSYNIYRALSVDSTFSLVANVPEEEHDDSLVAANTGYLYYVKALYSGAVESARSNTVFVQTGSLSDTTGDDSSGVVQFSSAPILSAQVGQPYEYQTAVVTTPPGQTVCFELTEAPAGMTVDANGLVQWVPSSLGVFEVEVRARICPGGEDAEQKFFLMVLSGAAATIHGAVTDTSGAPLDSIRIKIFDVTAGVFVLKARTDASGLYNFPVVNPGTYYVRADADHTPFEDVWYVNSRELAGASAVVVPEGGEGVADFTLSPEGAASPEYFTVSGTVRDSSGGPVAGASVSLMKRSHDYGDDDDFFDDDSDDGGYDDHGVDDDHERHAVTDSMGAFQVSARAGDYIVRAKAPGYLEQYWEGKPSPLEARILALGSDTSVIDFALVPRGPGMEGQGSISGTVRRADTQTPLRAEVLGFMKNSSGAFTGLIASDHTDSTGAYALDELPAGFYLVMVKDEDGIVPSFYSNAGSTAFGDSATLVAVDNSPVAGVDIDAIVDSADGLNGISGEVEIEIETPGKAAYRAPGALTSLAGAIVTVVDGQGKVVGSGLTGPDGAYTAPGIAPGDYTVVFQKPGAVTVSAPGTVAYQGGLPATTTVHAAMVQQSTPGGVTLFAVNAGWNLVSVAMAVPDQSPSAVFPTATSQAFAYTGSYQAVATTENGRGYWVKFQTGQVLSVSGTELISGSIQLSKGWNIVGPLTAPVAAASLTTTPPGLISSDIYGYDGGYQAAITLHPGKGYWIKASAAGSIEFTGAERGFSVPAAGPAETGASPAYSIEFADDLGNRQTLSVAAAPVDAALTELPPVPPVGAFDVRFASGHRTAKPGTAGPPSGSYPIRIQPAGGNTRVTLPVAPRGMSFTITDATGSVIATSSDTPVTADLGRATEMQLMVSGAGRPGEYRLDQNYPNPFNPATTISWQLPTDSRVVVRIFNALGQTVATLVNGDLPAGMHAATWDAGAFASGVYFTRIEASSIADPGASFAQTRKMLLVR